MNLKNTPLRRIIFFVALIGVGMIFLSFLAVSIQIGFSIKEKCQLAQEAYKNNDGVEALIDLIKDEQKTLKERNGAVWALGQLQDKKALPVLEKYYTGEECDHEKYLCQHELKKAINLINGFNVSALVWRKTITGMPK